MTRVNKRHVMIGMDILRAGAVAFIPLLPNVWAIYFMLFLIGMAKAIFNPTSMTFTTQLVPKPQRKRFNSMNSLITSGAFIVGPAIAGVLIMVGSVDFAIYINAASFLVSAFMLFLLPDVDKEVDLNKENLQFKSCKQTGERSLHMAKGKLLSYRFMYCTCNNCLHIGNGLPGSSFYSTSSWGV